MDVSDEKYLYIWDIHKKRQCEKIASAFHLPEVCRKIYSETALVAYSQSTFTFGLEYLNSRNCLTLLKPVQRRAITSIELDPEVLNHYVDDIPRNMLSDRTRLNRKPFKATFFPNLKRLIISRLTFEYTWKDKKYMLQADYKEWITRALQRREGRDIKVEFKDPDPSW